MENIGYFARKKITMDKFSTQVKVSTGNSISKILSVSQKSIITSCDIMNGYISLSGKINVNVIYISQENLIENSEMVFDFIEKQQINCTLEDIFAEDNIELKNINYSGNDVICIFEHNICLNGNYKYEIPIFNDDNNLVTKGSKFDSLRYITSCEDNFVVAEVTEVNLDNITIINYDASVILYETICLVDRISVEGKIISNIVYKDEQGIGSLSKEFDFKQEISADGVVPNMILSAYSNVTNVNISAEANDLKTNLTYEISVFVKGLIYEENTYEFVDDMFSLSNNISTTFDYIEARSFSNMKNYSDTFMLSTDISNIENFDDVIGVCLPKFKLDSIEELEEKSLLTGTITSDAVYRADEKLSTIQTSLPIKIEIPRNIGEVVGKVNTALEITSFKVKAGKFLEVVYILNYSVIFENTISTKFVKSYELKSEKNINTSGIKLYITSQGETLFDVAKKLNVKPDIITNQNEVFDTFEQGEKIYIYSPINLCN
ncbi:MAG: DUF3794 domain-containing protein [Clostridia bacterium]|nr:DUF3794 domain-containing protein [Clostridia bacterium]